MTHTAHLPDLAEAVTLHNADVQVVLDPGQGCDVLCLLDRRTGIDVLFRTPWHEHAEAVRSGRRPVAEPGAAWLEQYRGGWQTLCPVAGPARMVHSAPVGFHGEASRLQWQVDRRTETTLTASAELFSVPVRIRRHVVLAGPRLSITDEVSNDSPTNLQVDYTHHPAFGGELLDGPTRIETNARTFTPDPERPSALTKGPAAWPNAAAVNGGYDDLSLLPGPGTAYEIFGWLSDFHLPDPTSRRWTRLVNPARGLAVEVSWTGLPYAWLWAELEHTDQFPWYRRARAVALEPASVQTSGPARASTFTLSGFASREVTVSVEVQERN